MEKYRRRASLGKRIAVGFVAALVLLLLGLLVLQLCGVRYTICNKLDGTEVKFIGRVDRDGSPLSGKIIYPDGITATVSDSGKTVKYSNGSVYQGKLNEIFERVGEGTLTLKNGDSVNGTFSGNVLNGYAVYHFANGDVYEGDFVNNVKQGQGKYTYADGEVYEGGFNMDVRHGSGKMTKSDGSSYEGGYEMGMKWGDGVCVYANGDKYAGEFSYDMRNGKGTYTWANGESYTGEFQNNNLNGYGTYAWTNGRLSYTGYFENGSIVMVDPLQDNTVQTPAG